MSERTKIKKETEYNQYFSMLKKAFRLNLKDLIFIFDQGGMNLSKTEIDGFARNPTSNRSDKFRMMEKKHFEAFCKGLEQIGATTTLELNIYDVEKDKC